MAKLIELQEAAKMIGVTPEELTEMRSRNEIFGYRDGSSWKFKIQEIERVASERGTSLNDPTDDADDDSVDLDLDGSGDADSILISENELGKSDATSATVIGKPDPLGSGTSDISLDLDEEGSELRLLDSSASNKGMTSDVLDIDNDDELGSSELKLQDSGSFDINLDDDDDDDVTIDVGGEEDLASSSQASASGFGSAIDLDLNDDELVLGSGSDVTAGAGDSGINLTNPSDSGLSLEEPLDLAGGSAIDSLELGEDDMIVMDDDSGVDDLKGDDEFLLTPDEDDADDESSGSQVIDLDSAEFDESAATILADNASPMDEAVAFETLDDDGGGMLEPAAAGGAAVAATGAAALAAPRAGSQSEAQYSIWNVLSLFVIVLFLGVTGMMLADLINNIWSWDQNYAFKSTIMDTILSMLGSSS